MKRKSHNYRHRILVLLAFLILAFLVIEVRLWSLQIWLGDYYRMRADEMHRTMETVGAPRGRIHDRNGLTLAEDAASFDVYADVTAENVDAGLRNFSALLTQRMVEHPRLSELFLKQGQGKPEAAEKSVDDTSWQESPLAVVAYSVDYDVAETISVRQTRFPGIIVKLNSRRIYPRGETACHVLGHLGPMKKGEPETLIPLGYRLDDNLGRCGIELKREESLRGKRGGRVVERDFKRGGEEILMEIPSRHGFDEKLTLDLRLQKVAEQALGERPSAAVVMNAQNGSILVMASRPGYDPSVFAPPRSIEVVKALLADERKPMLNRVIQGRYPLGSIYKLVTAVAGIETGKITDDETHFECHGSYRLGRGTFRCWRRAGGHGSIDLGQAIEQSCNVFFYKSAESIGGDSLSSWGRAFGFGAKTGIDIPYEKAGFVPSPAKRSRPWTGGDTLNLGIGQGDLMVTPLQVARCVAAIANGGWLVKPRVMVSTAPSRTRVNVRPDTLEKVRRGMWMVVNSQIGTGTRAYLENVEIAGKTATAEVERLPDHAWFTAFAPYDKPQICIVVFVEYGGKGGPVAAPIAAKILKAYFGDS